jgi:hypothetical protein
MATGSAGNSVGGAVLAHRCAGGDFSTPRVVNISRHRKNP